ncbi:MAG: BrnT family toxin [Rhodoferax sp.]|uniref:BrnT family toxin n=1 Tax=Rhodoferax sp. TaxID=50421 RepID=UPI003267505C
MQITFDSGKNERNIRDRNLPFRLVAEFDFETAHIQTDTRKEYGETRYIALGSLHGRLHVLCFTETADGIRVISFRKANDREVKHYVQIQTPG